MTPIAQLIAELRDDVAELEGSAASGRKVLTDECVDRIRRAAEALARQEELLAEAGKVVEPLGLYGATIPETADERTELLGWNGHVVAVADFRAAARLSDKLKGE